MKPSSTPILGFSALSTTAYLNTIKGPKVWEKNIFSFPHTATTNRITTITPPKNTRTSKNINQLSFSTPKNKDVKNATLINRLAR